MARTYGLIPSTPSDADSITHPLFGVNLGDPLASATDLLPLVWTHNQGGTNSCVYQAIMQWLRTFLLSRGMVGQDFWASSLFGYWNTLKKQGQIVDGGCEPRLALEVLADEGFCLDADWPFDESKVLSEPLPDAYTAANDQKMISGYYRLTSTGDDLIFQIKTALSHRYPVIYGSPVDMDYENYDGTSILGPRTGQILGNHMRCLVGYQPDYAIESNSWGDRWGNGGTGKIGWDWITSSQVFEFWALNAAPKPTTVSP